MPVLNQDEISLFRAMKLEIIRLMKELQVNCPDMDTLIFEICYTRDRNYIDVVCFEDVWNEGQYNNKPRKNSRYNQSYNLKMYPVENVDNEYELKFRLTTTGTLSELQ